MSAVSYPSGQRIQRFTRDELPPPEDFHEFEKKGRTRIARVNGPFSCKTIDGNVAVCPDGWVALDDQGFPYPVADSVFKTSYRLPTEQEAVLRAALRDLIEAADAAFVKSVQAGPKPLEALARVMDRCQELLR